VYELLTPIREPDPKDIPIGDENWIAECQSLQPDRYIDFPVLTAWDSLCLIYLLSHVSSLYWLTDEIHRRIAQKAYQSDYKGEWRTVQEILEQYPQTPEQFYLIFLRYKSPEEFFGNLKKRARRLLYLVRYKRREPSSHPRRTNRPRGYRDKGTLRPSHRPRVMPPEQEPKEDRRKLIGHPLIHEEEDENPGEASVSVTQKGGNR
jgi:hypothetical protein